MADISVRRESRRRKLLQSSEERLQRIKQLNEKQQGSVLETKEDAVVMPAAMTRLVLSHQAQSENAHEGEEIISTLPQEDSQAERSCQIDADGTQELGEQHGPDQGAQTASQEQIGRSSIVEDSETNPTTDPTHVQPSNELTECPDDPTAKTCSFPVDSTQRTHRNLIQNTSPSIPSSDQIPVPASSADRSLTEQPQQHLIEQDVQRLSSALETSQAWMEREVIVVPLAVLMRGLLLVEWFKSISGQSVIIPFVVLEVMFFYFQPQTLQPTSGVLVRVLSFAAMLCSIPQDIIRQCQLALAVISTCCEDLALYLFVFILTHTIVEMTSN